jgi:hypothetical protein
MGYGGLTPKGNFWSGAEAALGTPPNMPASSTGSFEINVVNSEGKALVDAANLSLSIDVAIDFHSGLPVVKQTITDFLSMPLEPKALGETDVTVTKVPDGYVMPGPFRIPIKPKQKNILTIVVEKSQTAAVVAVSAGVVAAGAAVVAL